MFDSMSKNASVNYESNTQIVNKENKFLRKGRSSEQYCKYSSNPNPATWTPEHAAFPLYRGAMDPPPCRGLGSPAGRGATDANREP